MRMSAIKCYVVYLFDFFKGLKDAPLMLPSSTRRWLPVVQCYENVAGLNISSLPLGYLRVGDTCSTPMISRATPSHMLQIPRQSIPHLTLDSEVRKKRQIPLKYLTLWGGKKRKRELKGIKEHRACFVCVRGGGFQGLRGQEMQCTPEPWLKMDKLYPLFSSVTVNGGPDISFLRAEREVVCHPLILFFWVCLVTYGCNSYPNSLTILVLPPPGDPQSLFRWYWELHGQAAANCGGCNSTEPEEEEK